MAEYEYAEHFVPFGPNRDRAAMLDGLNKLGHEGWEVVASKDVIAPTVTEIAGKDGRLVKTTMMIDGIRFLCKRVAAAPSAVFPGSPPPPEALKKMRDKAAV